MSRATEKAIDQENRKQARPMTRVEPRRHPDSHGVLTQLVFIAAIRRYRERVVTRFSASIRCAPRCEP